MRACSSPQARLMSVIDVPGHERFVRTMVAGATGIDMYLMTVAADDGVMPQTREHAAVLEALGGRHRRRQHHEVGSRRPRAGRPRGRGAPPRRHNRARVGTHGSGARRAAPGARRRRRIASESRRGRPTGLPSHRPRVHDQGCRHGYTGTLWSGSIAVGDRLTLLPGGTPARVEQFRSTIARSTRPAPASGSPST